MKNKARKNGIPNLKMKIIIILAFLGIIINKVHQPLKKILNEIMFNLSSIISQSFPSNHKRHTLHPIVTTRISVTALSSWLTPHLTHTKSSFAQCNVSP